MFRKGIMVLCSMVCVGSTWANVEVHPFIGLQSVTDSNIYLAPSGEQSSMVTTLSPGVKLLMPVGIHQIGLNLRIDSLTYGKLPENNNGTNTTINLLGNYKLPSETGGVKLTYDYLDTTDPAYSELVARLKRKQNNIGLNFGYNVTPKFSFGLGYTSVQHDYEDAAVKAVLNRTEGLTAINLYYNFSPKTSALLEYDMGTIAYVTSLNDSTLSNIQVGVKGQLTAKTVGTVKVGSQTKKYDLLAGKDATPSIYTLSTLTKFTEMTQLILTGAGGAVESIYGTNPYYNMMSFRVGVLQKIASQWNANVSLGYETDSYPYEIAAGVAKREDTNTNYGIGVKYQIIKSVSAELNYASRIRDSNSNTLDFVDSLTGLNLKAEF